MRPESVTVTFSQDTDCCSDPREEFNVLTIKTDDGGGGPYLVLMTERWALCREEISRFAAALKKALDHAEGK